MPRFAAQYVPAAMPADHAERGRAEEQAQVGHTPRRMMDATVSCGGCHDAAEVEVQEAPAEVVAELDRDRPRVAGEPRRPQDAHRQPRQGGDAQRRRPRPPPRDPPSVPASRSPVRCCHTGPPGRSGTRQDVRVDASGTGPRRRCRRGARRGVRGRGGARPAGRRARGARRRREPRRPSRPGAGRREGVGERAPRARRGRRGSPAEIAVAAALAGAGAPVVAPSPEAPAVVHEHAGVPVTLWTFVPDTGDPLPDPARLGAMLADLHAALRACAVDLPLPRAAARGRPAVP